MAVGKYDTHVKPKLLLIEAWGRDGLTDEMICKNLGISVASFHNYKKEHLEFLEALKRGKEEIDIMVENALLKSALGYQYTETTHEAIKIGEDQTEAKLVKTVLKEVAPNTTSLIFWLKNRKRKEWRDQQDIDHSGNVGVNIVNNIPRSKGS